MEALLEETFLCLHF